MDTYQYMTQKGYMPIWRLEKGLRQMTESERLAEIDDFATDKEIERRTEYHGTNVLTGLMPDFSQILLPPDIF